jgi:RNA 3'-terminal phosphate cyclase (ATP)
MLVLDGSQGEGGGQILRSALSLSLLTGTPFRIENIRAGRPRPGLMRQHLTAVQAAATISAAEVSDAAIGARSLTFRPGPVRAGAYELAVGTAGSTTLVLQTVLLALATAEGSSTLRLEGGTHNPTSPPYEFLAKAYLPLLRRMGPRVEATLERAGFYPAGGGRLAVSIEPCAKLAPLAVEERGAIVGRRARAVVANLPRGIAERELRELTSRLGWGAEGAFSIETCTDSLGPGNVVMTEIESQHLTEVFVGFGMKGVAAEVVALGVADETNRYLASGAPVGQHLADQLVLPLALAGAGSFRTSDVTPHTRSQLAVVERFLEVRPRVQRLDDGTWRFECP